jgi:hypothetical protein
MIVAAGGCDRGGPGKANANSQRATGARIEVQPDVVDMGRVLVGDEPQASVQLVNTGVETARLLQCKTSCKCTAADCPAGQEIAPGESTRITLSLKPDRPSALKQQVTFMFQDHDPLPVSVVAEVIARVSADPPTLHPESNADGRFVLRANDGEAFRVLGATPALLVETGPGAAEQELAIVWDRWDGNARVLTLDLDHPKVKQVKVGLGQTMRDPTRPAGPSSIYDALAVAVKRGDMETLRNEIGDLTVPREKNSLLVRAARWGNAEAIDILLDAGADVNGGSDAANTPLMWAVQSGRVEPLRRLIKRGADVNARDENQGTALTWAAGPMGGHVATISTLVGAGAEVDVADISGMTPLMWAARWGEPTRVQALLTAGADLTLRDHEGRTAIDHAKARSGPEAEAIVELLLSVR